MAIYIYIYIYGAGPSRQSAGLENASAKLCIGAELLLSVMLLMELWRKALRRCKAFAQRSAPKCKAFAQRNAPVV